MAHRLPAAGKKTAESEHFQFHRVVEPSGQAPKCHSREPQDKKGGADKKCGLKAKKTKQEQTNDQCKCGYCTPSSSKCPEDEYKPISAPLPDFPQCSGHSIACWPQANPKTCLCPLECQRVCQELDCQEKQARGHQEQPHQGGGKPQQSPRKKGPKSSSAKKACPCQCANSEQKCQCGSACKSEAPPTCTRCPRGC